MRNLKCLIFLLLAVAPVLAVAQTSPDNMDLTGLWKGTLYNDSTQQNYAYEIGISEEKGKLVGFSHTWYNDSAKYFVLKKLKIKKADGKVIIEDVDIISYNYPEAPPKGVRRLHVLSLEAKDSILVLSGLFSTNRTKQYSPATGTVRLQRKNDYMNSTLVPLLKETGKEDQLSFVVRDKEIAKKSLPVNTQAPVVEKVEIAKVGNKEMARLEKEKKAVAVKEAKQEAANKKIRDKEEKEAINLKAKEAVAEEKARVAAARNLPAPVTQIIVPAADVMSRQNILQETMYFKTDSLELALYDNGEVDGDTVSVLMNGVIIMAKQGLSTNAIRKTINIPVTADSIELIMYAENLGAIAPNTGLLVVKDGKDIYEIRFSGDLQKNAAIILKRRKK